MDVTYRVDKEALYIAIEGRIDASNASAAEEKVFNIKNEYPGMQPVTVITFKEEPDELILQLLSKCIPWFNEYGIDLRFQLNDEYFRISVSKG